MKYIAYVRRLYKKNIREHDREARFLVLVSFLLTFILVRGMVYSIKYHWFPSRILGDIYLHDMHIHHLVFGIVLLLFAGIIRIPRWDDTLVRFSSVTYGIGAALTLDEFSLWLRLNPDAYFGPQGRISIDAVILFILILVLTLWYGNFWRRVANHTFLYIRVVIRKQFLRSLLFRYFLIICIVIAAVVSFLAYVSHTKPLHKLKQGRSASTSATFLSCRSSPISFPISVPAPKIASVQSISYENDYCLHVPVLYYHHVEPWPQAVMLRHTALAVDNTIFNEQMRYLITNGYTTISTHQLVSALRARSILPQKSVVLTFDDGYKDIYDYAFPLFKKYHLKASLAVPTGLLGTRSNTNTYFSWEQLREMVNSGLVTADDHTWSHYALGFGDMKKNQFEIATPIDQLERFLGKPIDILVYPYGSYKQWLFPLLMQDGIAGAFTTQPGDMQCRSQIYSLKRTRIANGALTSFGL